MGSLTVEVWETPSFPFHSIIQTWYQSLIDSNLLFWIRPSFFFFFFVSSLCSCMASPGGSVSPLPSVPNHVGVKLTPTNYLLWKTQFMPLLRSLGLVGLVDGTDLCPPSIVIAPPTFSQTVAASSSSPLRSSVTDKVNPLYQQWVCKDQMLLT